MPDASRSSSTLPFSAWILSSFASRLKFWQTTKSHQRSLPRYNQRQVSVDYTRGRFGERTYSLLLSFLVAFGSPIVVILCSYIQCYPPSADPTYAQFHLSLPGSRAINSEAADRRSMAQIIYPAADSISPRTSELGYPKDRRAGKGELRDQALVHDGAISFLGTEFTPQWVENTRCSGSTVGRLRRVHHRSFGRDISAQTGADATRYERVAAALDAMGYIQDHVRVLVHFSGAATLLHGQW